MILTLAAAPIGSRVRSLALAALVAAAWFGGPAPQVRAEQKGFDNVARCVYYNRDGTIEFFLPGEKVWVQQADGTWVRLRCGWDGEWGEDGSMRTSAPNGPRGQHAPVRNR